MDHKLQFYNVQIQKFFVNFEIVTNSMNCSMNNRINFMCTGTAENQLWRVEEFLPSTAGMRQKKKISAGTADIFLDWIDFVLLHFMRISRRKDVRMDLLIHKSSGEAVHFIYTRLLYT